MLETPLYGRFLGEDRRLAFLPPAIYLGLVRGVLIAGVLCLLNAFLIFLPSLYPLWWLMLGVMLLSAGILAAFSLHSVHFDLRESRYRRRQGPGLFPRLTTGKLDALDAVVLVAEPNAAFVLGGVTYHLILHWKGAVEPPMLLQSDTRSLPPGAPLNAASAPIAAVGLRYAKALRVPFYDNAHLVGRNPMPVFR